MNLKNQKDLIKLKLKNKLSSLPWKALSNFAFWLAADHCQSEDGLDRGAHFCYSEECLVPLGCIGVWVR